MGHGRPLVTKAHECEGALEPRPAAPAALPSAEGHAVEAGVRAGSPTRGLSSCPPRRQRGRWGRTCVTGPDSGLALLLHCRGGPHPRALQLCLPPLG